jgi:hypothetical protein
MQQIVFIGDYLRIVVEKQMLAISNYYTKNLTKHSEKR